MGDYTKARQYYEQALATADKARNLSNKASSLIGVAVVAGRRGAYSQEVRHLRTALTLANESGQVRDITAALSNLGGVYQVWGQYLKAMDYYEKALDLDRKARLLSSESKVLINIGNLYMDFGQPEEAAKRYERALEIKDRIGDANGTGRALILLAKVRAAQCQYDQALEILNKAIDIWNRIHVPTRWAKDLMANIYLDLGKTDEALPLVEESGYLSTKGRLSLMKSQYQEARDVYDRLRKSAEKNNVAENLFVAYTGLGAVYEGLGDNAQAAKSYRRAVTSLEEIRSSLKPSQRATFFNMFVGGFSRTAPYEGLSRTLIRTNNSMQALSTSEYTKARVFAEAMLSRAADSQARIPPQIVENDEALKEEFAALSRSLMKARKEGKSESVAVLAPQVREAKENLERHIELLRKDYPLFAATRYPQPLGLRQAALKDNEWLLAYDVTDCGLIIYLTCGKKLVKTLFEPIPRKELDGLVRAFREPMEITAGDSPDRKLRSFNFEVGKKLAEVLVGGITPHIPAGKPLLIIPDESLGVLPFEMLPILGEGRIVEKGGFPCVEGVEFFANRHAVSYYQSITALTLARTFGEEHKRARRTLVLVDPVFSPDDDRAKKLSAEKGRALLDKLTGERLMSVKTQLSGLEFKRLSLTADLGHSLKRGDPENTDLCEGFEARKSALLQKNLTPYGSIVFATHGYFGTDLPTIQEPVLVLTLLDQPKGQDGFLKLSEVMGLKINCDIAALTACQTGLGRHVSGEGTMGMGRAFQYAGAKSVLMSLWSVSETASVNLVENFFKYLKEGKSKLEALRLARDAIRKAGYDHPFFWAPFILVGKAN